MLIAILSLELVETTSSVYFIVYLHEELRVKRQSGQSYRSRKLDLPHLYCIMNQVEKARWWVLEVRKWHTDIFLCHILINPDLLNHTVVRQPWSTLSPSLFSHRYSYLWSNAKIGGDNVSQLYSSCSEILKLAVAWIAGRRLAPLLHFFRFLHHHFLGESSWCIRMFGFGSLNHFKQASIPTRTPTLSCRPDKVWSMLIYPYS